MTKFLRKLALSTALLAAASTQAFAIDVEWWDFLGGGDGVRMKALIEKFNTEHPDIQIKATTLEWGTPYYTKVRTAVGVGQGPDIMTYHLSRLPLALTEGSLSEITDADLTRRRPDQGKFPRGSAQSSQQRGWQALRHPVRYPCYRRLLQQEGVGRHGGT